ncbi:phage stabilization protein [Caudoviricetes sp.]|nr:phage stabilization protein [Caudoviricetes sp.]
MGTNLFKTQFSGGEVSPALYARVDAEIYRTGAKKIQNFFVRPQGGLMNRAGTEFVGHCRQLPDTPEVRLIPFQFNETDSYVLEFSHKKMRVIQDGGYVLATETVNDAQVLIERRIANITKASPAVMTTTTNHGFADGDHIQFLGITGGMTEMNGLSAVVDSHTATTITLANYDGSPFDTSNFTAFTNNGNASNGRIRVVYTKSMPYDSVDLAELKYDQNADKMTFCHPDYPAKFLTRQDHAVWRIDDAVFEPTISPPLDVIAKATHSVSVTIDGLTKDNPAQISFAGVGESGTDKQAIFRRGSVGYIRNVGGMYEMNNKVIVLGDLVSYDNQTYEVQNTSLEGINTTANTTYTSGGSLEGDTLYRYVVTSVDSAGRESRPCDAVLVISKAMSSLVDSGTPFPKITLEWLAVDGADSYNVYRQREVSSGQPSIGSIYGYLGNTKSPQFVDQNTSPDFTKTPPQESNPFLETIIKRYVTNISLANPAVVTTNGNHNLVSGDFVKFYDVAGMREINGLLAKVKVISSVSFEISRQSDGTDVDSTNYNPFLVQISGITKANPAVITTAVNHNFKLGDLLYISQVAGMVEINGIVGKVVAYTANTLTLQDTATGKRINSTSFTTYTSGGHVRSYTGYIERRNPLNNPVTTCYYQQRKVYAGSYENPQTMWLSQSGDYQNMDKSTPIRDSDAIELTLDSKKVNIIKHIIPLSTLLVFTSGGCFKVGGGQSSPITPTSIQATLQTSQGASDVSPLILNSDILYIQNGSTIVNSLSYNFYSDTYSAQDLSIRARHLFEVAGVKEWADATIPNNLIVAVREDGKLLFLTYVKDAQIVAWSWGDTGNNGVDAFESICSIRENGEDTIYLVTRRYICNENGCMFRRFVERMHSRNIFKSGENEPRYEDMLFSDCSVKYNGTKTSLENSSNSAVSITELKGLDHLEGREVCVVVDGNVLENQIVTGGKVTFNRSGVIVHVGLPYLSEAVTLPIDTGDGKMAGKKKTITKVRARIINTRGMSVSLTGVEYTSAKEGSPYASRELELISGDQEFSTPSYTSIEGLVYVRQALPLPCEMTGLIPEISQVQP